MRNVQPLKLLQIILIRRNLVLSNYGGKCGEKKEIVAASLQFAVPSPIEGASLLLGHLECEMLG